MKLFERFLALTKFQLSEVDRFGWNCFGDSAHVFTCWNGDHQGHSFNATVSLDTMSVHVLEVCDYQNNRAYRWFNPDTDARDAYFKAATAHDSDLREAWDDVNFVDLEVPEDFFVKAEAIRDHKFYDHRVTVPLELSDKEMFELMKMAHGKDLTLNQLVEQVLWNVVGDHEKKSQREKTEV